MLETIFLDVKSILWNSQRSGFDSPEANLLSRLLTVRFETSLLSCLMDLLQPTALGDVSEGLF